MESKEKELNAVHLELRGNITVLEERVAREKSEKLVRLPLEKYTNFVMSVVYISFIILGIIFPIILQQEAIYCHKREKEAKETVVKLQASLESELEKTKQDKLDAEKRVISLDVSSNCLHHLCI